MKTRKIKERLAMIEKRLANAEKYVGRNNNIRSSSQEDWNGKSGHPLWMKNQMVPSTMKERAKSEKALETVNAKAKECVTGEDRSARERVLPDSSGVE